MPYEVKMMIHDQQLLKEEERRINQEMRRLAEEELMKEYRMAEEYFIRSEFMKSGKQVFPMLSDQEILAAAAAAAAGEEHSQGRQ
jgi:hypothetical protein